MRGYKLIYLLVVVFFSTNGWAQTPKSFRPAFNDSVSAFSAVLIDGELYLTIHDIKENETPQKETPSKLVHLKDSITLVDAKLFNALRGKEISLNIAGNTGPASISSDGSLLFVTNTSNGNLGGKMGLFVLERSSNGWIIQQECPFNSPNYSILHPAYDAKNKFLYFSSDKDSDVFNLWRISYDGVQFGEEAELLVLLSTPLSNEVFLSIHDNTLYYSTDRKNKIYLELYTTPLDKLNPQPFDGELFQSSFDDFSLIWLSQRTGLISSNRNTKGSKDELLVFRNPIDCSSLRELVASRSKQSGNSEFEEAMAIISEFRNVFGNENELSYRLSPEYLREKFDREEKAVADFYCNLFLYLDSVSFEHFDVSVKQSLNSERTVDSIFNNLKENIHQEVFIDSLISVIQHRYQDIGLTLELEEQKAVLKNVLAPLKAMTDSLHILSDTLKEMIIEQLAGLVIDPDQLPEFARQPKGLFFAIQVGAFSKKVAPTYFKNLKDVIEVTAPTGLTHYITGYCNNLDDAMKGQAQVRGVGYSDAFIVAYCDGQRIPLFKAKELLESGDCVPISQSVEPQVDYTVIVNPTDQNKPFTVKVDPNYNKAPGAAKAIASETREGLFFTVQIGVYDQPASTSQVQNMPDLITTLLPNGQIRYSSGMYRSEGATKERQQFAINRGFTDAFITAYYNGERISIAKARELLAEKGEEILEGMER